MGCCELGLTLPLCVQVSSYYISVLHTPYSTGREEETINALLSPVHEAHRPNQILTFSSPPMRGAAVAGRGEDASPSHYLPGKEQTYFESKVNERSDAGH